MIGDFGFATKRGKSLVGERCVAFGPAASRYILQSAQNILGGLVAENESAIIGDELNGSTI